MIGYRKEDELNHRNQPMKESQNLARILLDWNDEQFHRWTGGCTTAV